MWIRTSKVFALCTVMLFITSSISFADGVMRYRHHSTGQALKKSQQYLSDQIIVKFKDTIQFCPHCLFLKKSSFQQASLKAASVSYLDKLNKKYQVSAIEPLFRSQEQENQLIKKSGIPTSSDLKNQQAAWFSAIKAKFPERTRKAVKQTTEIPDLYNFYIIHLPANKNILQAVHEYAQDPLIESAQPNYLIKGNIIPDDPYYRSGAVGRDLWGLKKIGMEEAWDLEPSLGAGIIVAVNDTGVDYNHLDIRNNMWKDDAGNYGPNIIEDSNDPMDMDGHGTHIAGTIAAEGNNHMGIIGVAPKSKIMAMATVDIETGVEKGILYALEHGAKVINNSWGYRDRVVFSASSEAVIKTAYAAGVINVLAAGNESDDVQFKAPANLSEVIAVAASDRDDTLANFSNNGQLVDVSAPGVSILSLNARGGDNHLVGMGFPVVDTDYLLLSGTSMATPHVVGVISLLMKHHPEFSVEDIRQALHISADNVAKGADGLTGYGRINAAKALKINNILHAYISSPQRRALITPGAIINIEGSANGVGFQKYQLFYSVGKKPGNWVPLADAVYKQVNNGILGRLDTGAFVNNKIWIKLVVVRADGQVFEHKSLIIVYGSSNYRPLNLATSNQISPIVDGDRIVYIDDRNDRQDIYLYDFKLNKEKQLSDDTLYKDVVSISGDKVVWDAYDDDGVGHVYFYNLSTDEHGRITTASDHEEYSPNISGQKVVWTDKFGTGQDQQWRVYLYDFDSKQVNKVSETSLLGSPLISGNRVAWKSANQKLNILNLEDKSVQEVKEASNQFLSAFNGNKVVFMDGDFNYQAKPIEDKLNSYTIYIYDVMTHQTTKILPPDAYGIQYPNLSGDNLVYQDGRDGEDVYLYDLKTAHEVRLTYDGSFAPIISGNHLIFSNDNTKFYQTYLYEVPPNQYPDLNLKMLTVEYIPKEDTAPVEVSCMVENKGYVDSLPNMLYLELDRMGINGQVFKDNSTTIKVPLIKAGKQIKLNAKLWFVDRNKIAKEWRIKGAVDVNQTINESDKLNNASTTSFNIKNDTIK